MTIILGWPALLIYIMTLMTRPCPNVDVIDDFKFEEYYGDWHEMYYTKGAGGGSAECNTNRYSEHEDGSVTVVSATWSGMKGHQDMSLRTGSMHSTTGNSSMSISFDGVSSEKYPYTVISTDYDSYSVVYECGIELGFQRTEKLWILTRDALVRDTPQFNAMKLHVFPIIDKMFKKY